MRWVQGPRQSTIYNLNNVCSGNRRYFRKKDKECSFLKAIIEKFINKR